jgi:cytochrome c oxidase subunit III
MKQEFQQTNNQSIPEQKAKKNLVWVVVFSITMMFAGFTSAYIVSMGDNFWIKVNLPSAFYFSTAAIVLSSITLWMALRASKKNALSSVKLFTGITLVLGLSFAYLQFRGYNQLIDRGAMPISWIIVNDGRYGDYYEVKMDGRFLEVVNNQYAMDGKSLEGQNLNDLKSFFNAFVGADFNSQLPATAHDRFKLFYKGEPLEFSNGKLVKTDGEALLPLEFERLAYLAQNIKDDRADFFMKGEIGKDFNLFYQGKPLEYKDRRLFYNGQQLSNNLNNKLIRGNSDTSTAYLYVITFLHLLHVLAGIIMLIVLFRKTFNGKILNNDALAIKTGGIFWHFLGALWIYLLLFLVFIH